MLLLPLFFAFYPRRLFVICFTFEIRHLSVLRSLFAFTFPRQNAVCFPIHGEADRTLMQTRLLQFLLPTPVTITRERRLQAVR